MVQTYVCKVVASHGNNAPHTRDELTKLIVHYGAVLVLELSLVRDIGLHLIKLCYLSEGDKIISPYVYQDIEDVSSALNSLKSNDPSGVLPSLFASARKFISLGTVTQAEPAATIAKALPVVEKFEFQFKEKHKDLMQTWRFCRLFNYHFIASQDLEFLKKEIEESIVEQLSPYKPKLIDSLSLYKSNASGAGDRDLVDFWNDQKNILQSWFFCFQMIALIQPSSAAAERVFAQLRSTFDEQQESTLEDFKEG